MDGRHAGRAADGWVVPLAREESPLLLLMGQGAMQRRFVPDITFSEAPELSLTHCAPPAWSPTHLSLSPPSALAAVLKCAKAKPREAATFLGYATAVVGIAPSGIDLAKITGGCTGVGAGGRQNVGSSSGDGDFLQAWGRQGSWLTLMVAPFSGRMLVPAAPRLPASHHTPGQTMPRTPAPLPLLQTCGMRQCRRGGRAARQCWRS